MGNSIDAHVDFSFKGETYALASTIDLDNALDRHISLPSLHRVLAVENGIDTYSYLFEVMQEEEIRFDNPQGKARHYWKEEEFDFAGYLHDNETTEQFAPLQAIALREMGIEDLEQHPQLKRALLHAYQLGVEK
jgi:hypothetical protein